MGALNDRISDNLNYFCTWGFSSLALVPLHMLFPLSAIFLYFLTRIIFTCLFLNSKKPCLSHPNQPKVDQMPSSIALWVSLFWGICSSGLCYEVSFSDSVCVPLFLSRKAPDAAAFLQVLIKHCVKIYKNI